MRTKEEIMKDAEGFTVSYEEALEIEVQVDIRDTLVDIAQHVRALALHSGN